MSSKLPITVEALLARCCSSTAVPRRNRSASPAAPENHKPPRDIQFHKGDPWNGFHIVD
jgi:hypothetical protein